MKKSILLATTALISAFALEAGATGIAVDLEATAKLVLPVSANCTQALDFGTLAFESGKKFVVNKDGTIGSGSSDSYMVLFGGTPKAGKVQFTTSSPNAHNHYSLVLPASIPMTYTPYGGGSALSCGSVGSLEQANAVLKDMGSGSGSNYEIAFGGVYTAAGSNVVTEVGAYGALTCSGQAEATLVYHE